MSIPGFFAGASLDGLAVYDGGLGNNFPLRAFMEDNHEQLFIGLYLTSEVRDDDGLLKNVMDIVVDGDDRAIVDQYRESIVKINPYPIRTTDFKIKDAHKDFLIKCGRVAAREYLYEYRKDLGIEKSEIETAKAELEKDREALTESYAPEKQSFL